MTATTTGRPKIQMSTTTLVAAIIFVVAAAGIVWAWERQSSAREWSYANRETVERTYKHIGIEDALLQASTMPWDDGESWRAATLVLGVVAVSAGATAVISRLHEKGKVRRESTAV